jgi:hypothetical protein
MSHHPDHSDPTELAALRAELVDLRDELAALREQHAADAAASTSAPTSRRGFVRAALALGAGGAVAALGTSAPAAATVGTMFFGTSNNAVSDQTSLTANRPGQRTLSVSNTGAGGYAYAGEGDTVYGGYGTAFGINLTSGGTGAKVTGQFVGLQAIAQNSIGSDGVGVLASGPTYGVYASGERAPLMLEKHASPPAFFHYSGELYSLGTGTTAALWVGVEDGSPGVFRKVAGPDTAGALHPVDPFRVYDSRLDPAFAASRIDTGGNRLISVADAIDLTTGAVATAGAVPEGATAIAYNLAVVDTVGAGFLSVTPGSSATFSAASINWSGTGQILANGQLAKLDTSRRVKVFAGGGSGAATHFVIDVQGYYL